MDLNQWERWHPLLSALYDGKRYTGMQLPGQCLTEWLEYIHHDYDDVDREFYLDTIGG